MENPRCDNGKELFIDMDVVGSTRIREQNDQSQIHHFLAHYKTVEGFQLVRKSS